MKANLEASESAEKARQASWAQKDAETQAHFDATQKEKEADLAYYHNETKQRTLNAYTADKASNEATIAAAEAEDKANAEEKA